HFFFSSRRRHTRFKCDWSSDVCSSDLQPKDSTGLPEWYTSLSPYEKRRRILEVFPYCIPPPYYRNSDNTYSLWPSPLSRPIAHKIGRASCRVRMYEFMRRIAIERTR